MHLNINNLLSLADDALILGHRNSEWCGHGPVLEQDIAISNIALDYIGLARNLYQHAATLINAGATEDTLAYLRDVIDFKNHLIVELPNGDWAQTILRIFFFSQYQRLRYQQLLLDTDKQIAAIAEKSLKEITYHIRWSTDWVLRLGDGTAESKARMIKAADYLWPYTEELFVDGFITKREWLATIEPVFLEATLALPSTKQLLQKGIEGEHTEHLGYILAEMQYLQRAYPNSEW
ncbi:MAG: 1,2-phenylacetyl-CoA epoxidase subunit PaaC [Sediminibacterium sp.]|jgi:ring-1,2-phenylacetyl-CoA epoxidase subunit PaaC|nr:phenylacetate-CoA oxygenase subunit PaaC [Chitinophagaceae bacterium]MCA6439373.1 phenylacetate-CoA oxygenase subunit PaaC [Chitinophagaceae bacterium]MCA6448281.1 phenylacetate-CoA oxygenase subunit PaaC [Chitinophagaceae bacterium]